MAKNGNEKRNGKNIKNDKKVSTGLQTHTKHGIIAIIFFVSIVYVIYYQYNLYSCNTLLIFRINCFFSKL